MHISAPHASATLERLTGEARISARCKHLARHASCGLLERCSGRTLTATMRSSRVSLARYTSPIPPVRIEEMIFWGT